jgi:WD40 repeat protein
MYVIGSHDCKMYVYRWETHKLLHTLKGHTSHITHMDWSADGAFLQSNCGGYELLFWEVATGQQVKKSSNLRLEIL